jgi:hypothetical protein
MSTTLALVGSVLDARGHLVLAAPGDLEATDSGALTAQLEVFSTIAGMITPFLVAFANRPTFSPFVRALIAIGASVVVGALTAAGEGQLNGVRWAVAALTVLTAATGSYKFLFPQPVARLELATSPKKARRRSTASGGN